MGDMPDAGTSPTCDTAGVLGSAVMIAASAQVADVIRLLVNGEENLRPRMLAFDLWGSGDAGKPRFHSIDATTLGASASCVCCGQRQFEFMRGDCSSDTLSLCGQNAVQITPAPVSNGGDGGSKRLDLDKIASMLRTIGRVTANGYLVRASVPRAGFDGGVLELTVFPDARAILKGTTNPALARAAYAQFVGA
jgi:adenylyltransferase/sulfurtransferase